MVKSTFDLVSKGKKHKKQEIAKRHRKRQLPKKYHSATPKAKEIYSAGITSSAFTKLAKQRGIDQIGLRTIDVVAEYLFDYAGELVSDAVRNAGHCKKKTVNQQHAREAIRTSRRRIGIDNKQLVGL